MRRLTRNEFDSRFQRRKPIETFSGLYRKDLHIDRDAEVAGLIEGSLYITGNAHVLLTGLVHGAVVVGRDSVLWVEGLVEGRITVDGAAFLNGASGKTRGDKIAVVFDPSEPADSETEPPIGTTS